MAKANISCYSDTTDLQNINLSSKDGKAIVPAVITLFQSFQEQLNSMFTKLQGEFVDLINKQSIEIANLRRTVGSLQKSVAVL